MAPHARPSMRTVEPAACLAMARTAEPGEPARGRRAEAGGRRTPAGTRSGPAIPASGTGEREGAEAALERPDDRRGADGARDRGDGAAHQVVGEEPDGEQDHRDREDGPRDGVHPCQGAAAPPRPDAPADQHPDAAAQSGQAEQREDREDRPPGRARGERGDGRGDEGSRHEAGGEAGVLGELQGGASPVSADGRKHGRGHDQQVEDPHPAIVSDAGRT